MTDEQILNWLSTQPADIIKQIYGQYLHSEAPIETTHNGLPYHTVIPLNSISIKIEDIPVEWCVRRDYKPDPKDESKTYTLRPDKSVYQVSDELISLTKEHLKAECIEKGFINWWYLPHVDFGYHGETLGYWCNADNFTVGHNHRDLNEHWRWFKNMAIPHMRANQIDSIIV